MAPALPLKTRGPQPRILIVRLSALGDLVFATSLLAGLRAAYPGAYIAWIAQEGFASILDGDPRLDELIRIPAGALGSPAGLLRLRAQLRGKRFDWAIEAQGLAKSRLVTALAPGATRIGFRSKEPLQFLLHHALPKGGDIRDISSEYRFLAESVTGQAAPPPSLVVSEAARVQAIGRLRELGLEPGFNAFCPFTTRPQKHWMEDYWPDLAQRLTRPCAVFGGPGDVAAAQRLCEAAPAGRMINLAGRTRLADVAAWIEQAGLVVGVDTGLTHIGIAVQRPTLALFGSTCPYTQGAASPLTVMYDALHCAPCKRHPTCGGSFDCLRGLTPLRVAFAAQQLVPGA